MKSRIFLLVLCAITSISAMAQTYGLDNADPSLFSKFRIPETDLSSLWFGTNLNYSSNKSTSQVYNNYLSTNFSYSLSPQYYLLKESDDRYLSLEVTPSGGYQNLRYGNIADTLSNNYTKSRTDNLNIKVNEIYRNYIGGNDLFYSISSNSIINIFEEYGDNPLTDTTRQTTYLGDKQQSYDFSFGIGWGKMRNVTPVVSALRFQDRLKQLNLLNSDLSEKTIEDLAQQFYREGYYASVHVRPDKYFWDDVEKTLSADNVSLSGLNQYADSYIREVPGELRFARNEGMVTGVNLQISYNNNYYSYAPINEQLYTLGNAYLDYSHQLNLNSQVSLNLSEWRAGFDKGQFREAGVHHQRWYRLRLRIDRQNCNFNKRKFWSHFSKYGGTRKKSFKWFKYDCKLLCRRQCIVKRLLFMGIS